MTEAETICVGGQIPLTRSLLREATNWPPPTPQKIWQKRDLLINQSILRSLALCRLPAKWILRWTALHISNLLRGKVLADVFLLCYQSLPTGCTGTDLICPSSCVSFHQLLPETWVGQQLQVVSTLLECPPPLLVVATDSGIGRLSSICFVTCVRSGEGCYIAHCKLQEGLHPGGHPKPTWKGPHFTLWLSHSCTPCWLVISL